VLSVAAPSLGDFTDESTAQQTQHQTNVSWHFQKTIKEQVKNNTPKRIFYLTPIDYIVASVVFVLLGTKPVYKGRLCRQAQNYRFQVGTKVGLPGPLFVFGYHFL
jgi:hypothetical protein